LDEKGRIAGVKITDDVHRKVLRLNPETKESLVSELRARDHLVGGPFDAVQKQLKEGNLQWVEKRKTATGEVNVFRLTENQEWSRDYWLDAKTKQLVGVRTPGADIFDPDRDPARNNPPEEHCSNLRPEGHVDRNIVFDAQLDESLFQLEPPAGYYLAVEPRRSEGTEKDMVEMLSVMVDFNDKTFPDRPWIATEPENKSSKMPEKERLAAKERLLDAVNRYDAVGIDPMPIYHFVQDRIVENSFRYLGKGVKLGEKDRIVCWYKLKGAKTYRVVYGDLSVKDVAPQDLPLPVEP
jgi:hypothetical protein